MKLSKALTHNATSIAPYIDGTNEIMMHKGKKFGMKTSVTTIPSSDIEFQR